MTRVIIDSGGHRVEVDNDNPDLTYVTEKARQLWDETRPLGRGAGPAIGFAVEREQRRNGYAYMGYGEQPEVRP